MFYNEQSLYVYCLLSNPSGHSFAPEISSKSISILYLSKCSIYSIKSEGGIIKLTVRTVEWQMIVVCNKCSNTVIAKNGNIIRYFSLSEPREKDKPNFYLYFIPNFHIKTLKFYE